MYSASGSSEGAEGEVEVEVVRGGKSSETAPANQSRLSEESGPPQWFCTARVRAGQRLRRREMPRSKVVWVCAGGELASGTQRRGDGKYLVMGPPF